MLVLLLIKTVLTSLTKKFLLPLRLTAATAATDALVENKFLNQERQH